MNIDIKRIPLLVFLMLFTLYGYAQVTIGSGIPPVNGAILDLKQQDKPDGSENSRAGMLLPRVKLTDPNNLFPMFTSDGAGGYTNQVKADEDALHTGLVVYNVNTAGCALHPGIFVWTGNKWASLSKPVDDDISGYSFDRARDSLALVALYNSTGGAGWTSKDNWLSSKPITEWAGVTCVEKCAGGKIEVGVTGIHFENNNLTGTLPVDLANLANLTQLSLPVGQLSGNIPDLSALAKLRIMDFRSNRLTGPIPSGLGSLPGLVTLDLQDNQLAGPIPNELGNLAGLRYLNLAYNNQLTGTLPGGLGNLANLIFFDVQYCSLSGDIPSTFSNLTNLVILYLSGNRLAGTIPANLLSVPNKRLCPQYQPGGSIINPNPWTNYNDVDCP